MNLQLRQYWELLRSSYWFLPTLMCLSACGAAILLVYVDYLILRERERVPDWIYQGSPEGARTVLSTIGGSMIGVAGVVFSINTVALTLASGQFGPRLMRNFLRDRANQAVLGTFLASFLYCLIVLVAVQGREEHQFTPRAAIAFAIVLAIAGLGMLIFFIHHVLVSIQATEVVYKVGRELRHTIDAMLPADATPESRAPTENGFEPDDSRCAEVFADSAGYIVGIDAKALVKVAEKFDVQIRMNCRPGHYLIPGEQLAWIDPREKATDELAAAVRGTLAMNRQRLAIDDLEFTVDQLVEIAVRSLSPGINDPFTAMNCIDALSEALGMIATRPLPSRFHYRDDKLRAVLHPITFGGVLDAAFNQIRQYGNSSPAVMIRLLEALVPLATVARRQADREAIAHHAKLVYEAGIAGIQAESDRQDLKQRYESIAQRLHD